MPSILLIKRHFLMCILGFLCGCYPLISQDRFLSGAVSGTVFCDDTKRPARFAAVRLTGKSLKGDFVSQTTTTDYDGTFEIGQVAPGIYVLDAAFPGYIDPLQQIDTSKILEFAGNSTDGSVAHTSVYPGQLSTTAISLERGASISGTILYEDGSPAESVSLSAILQLLGDTFSANGIQPTMTTGIILAQTDDRGKFRLSGLSSGRYTIRVTFPPPDLRPWFLGDTSSLAEAKSIKLVSGEEYDGIMIYLPDILKGR